MIYQFTNVNTTKLQDELLNRGIKFKQYISAETVDENGVARNAWSEFLEGTDMKLVKQIIDAHDPTPTPPGPTQEDFLLDLELRMTMLELGL